MRTILLLFTVVVNIGMAFSQKLKPFAYYLGHQKVIEEAKAYHNNKFVAHDDDRTIRVYQQVNEKTPDDLLPFYMYCFGRMLPDADGALSESMGDVAYRFSMARSAFFFDYFSSNVDERKIRMKQWASMIRDEIIIGAEEGKEDQAIKDYERSVRNGLKGAKVGTMKVAEAFFKML